MDSGDVEYLQILFSRRADPQANRISVPHSPSKNQNHTGDSHFLLINR